LSEDFFRRAKHLSFAHARRMSDGLKDRGLIRGFVLLEARSTLEIGWPHQCQQKLLASTITVGKQTRSRGVRSTNAGSVHFDPENPAHYVGTKRSGF
jgi:hypothetical protein